MSRVLDDQDLDRFVTVKGMSPSATPFVYIAGFTLGRSGHTPDMVQYQSARDE